MTSQLKERETISKLKSKGASAGIVALIPKQYSEFKAEDDASVKGCTREAVLECSSDALANLQTVRHR